MSASGHLIGYIGEGDARAIPVDSLSDSPARWTGRLEACAVAAAAIGFALHNGLQVGISNHCQYLLHGLHAADPAFLAGDWFTTQTRDHHTLFTLLVAFMQRLGWLHVGLGLLNAMASGVCAIAIYYMIRRCTPMPLGPYAVAMSLLAFMPPDGPGHSNILLPYFVPSVFSGVGVLASFALLMNGRATLAGIVAAMASALHANFLVLMGPAWLLVIAMTAKPERIPLAHRLLVPWLLAWIPHIPMFVAILSDTGPKAEARRIFWEVYAPLHYRPETWPMRQWLDFLLILAAGAVGFAMRRRSIPAVARRIAISIGGIVLAGAVAIVVFKVDAANAIFPWRMAPFLTIAAYVCIGMLADGDHRDWFSVLVAPAVATGLIALTEVDRRAIVLVAIGFGLSAILSRVDGSLTRKRHSLGRIPVNATTPTFALLLLILAAFASRSGLWRRDMFGHRMTPSEASLYAWVRESTPRGTVFAIPPDLFNFRLETGRAVVVDFKSFPLIPSDQLEWKRRHDIQAGSPVAGFYDALTKYETLDAGRLETLNREFGVRFAVLRHSPSAPSLDPAIVIFKNDRFCIVQLPDATHPSTDRPRP